MSRIRGILFDKDGTLTDFNATWAAVARKMALRAASGDAAHADRLLDLSGFDAASRSFSVFGFSSGRLRVVESVNRAADHMIARRLIASGAALSPEEAADAAFDLKARAMAKPVG